MIEKLDKVVPADSKDLRVVELGAGLGCIGNFLRLHKRCHVVLTDVTESLPLLQRNTCANFKLEPDGPEVLPLRWGDKEQIQVLTVCGSYDIVVGSDITYRPEHIDELLRTACALLKPGGRVHISLQDRPGEAENFRNAIKRSRFHIISVEEAPLPCSGSHKGSAMEEGAARWGSQAMDGVSQIFLFELQLKDEASSAKTVPIDPFPGLPSSVEDIEAEFFRLTGIQPDACLRPKARAEIPAPATKQGSLHSPPGRAVSSVAAPQAAQGVKKSGTVQLSAKSQGIKDKIVKEYLEHGLGALLCEIDEDVKSAMESKRKEDQPRTDEQKRIFAEAFYGIGSDEGVAAELAARDSLAKLADDVCGADSDIREATASGTTASAIAESSPLEAATGNVAAAVTDEQPKEVQSAEDVIWESEVRKCVPGLDWDVAIDEKERRLSATVNFSDEVWEALQGSKEYGAGSKSFRESVSFELSEQELRVTYMDSSVLELRLPQAVDPAAATAKLSSKLRRVTVGAALS
jgi:hypothetical protein